MVQVKQTGLFILVAATIAHALPLPAGPGQGEGGPGGRVPIGATPSSMGTAQFHHVGNYYPPRHELPGDPGPSSFYTDPSKIASSSTANPLPHSGSPPTLIGDPNWTIDHFYGLARSLSWNHTGSMGETIQQDPQYPFGPQDHYNMDHYAFESQVHSSSYHDASQLPQSSPPPDLFGGNPNPRPPHLSLSPSLNHPSLSLSRSTEQIQPKEKASKNLNPITGRKIKDIGDPKDAGFRRDDKLGFVCEVVPNCITHGQGSPRPHPNLGEMSRHVTSHRLKLRDEENKSESVRVKVTEKEMRNLEAYRRQNLAYKMNRKKKKQQLKQSKST